MNLNVNELNEISLFDPLDPFFCWPRVTPGTIFIVFIS